MLPKDKIYKCADCGKTEYFSSYRAARASGGAISKDYTTFYCAECAPAHRLGGANGKRTSRPSTRQWLPKGCKQLSIQEIVVECITKKG